MVCPPFQSLFSLAVRTSSIEDRVSRVQHKLFALRQILCEQSSVTICHVKGLAAFDTAHVQRTFAAFGIKVLIVDLARAALAAPTHFFLCL